MSANERLWGSRLTDGKAKKKAHKHVQWVGCARVRVIERSFLNERTSDEHKVKPEAGLEQGSERAPVQQRDRGCLRVHNPAHTRGTSFDEERKIKKSAD